jgi:3-phytase
MGLPFGGISGLAKVSDRQLQGISDGRYGGRIYRFEIDGAGGSLSVSTIGITPLEYAPGSAQADHEGLAVLPNGNFLMASEGTGREPRRPPSIAEFGRYGDFVRILPIRDRYVPEPTGPATRGARGNAGFESLTLSPDNKRLFTATETALIQDGGPATFEEGARTRILEYVARNDAFEPRAEFAYAIEPVAKPPFKAKAFMNGLVELLALSRTTLLALERGYVENAEKPTSGLNQIRVYRISLAGATDVSKLESLKRHPEVVPVTKTLLLDLADAKGLSHDLAPALDNFEGMSFGPRLADGRATLVLVSDDNFNAAQRTWFLVFGIE